MGSVPELVSYYGGAWQPALGSDKVDVVNPATAEKLGRLSLGNRADVDAVVRSAAAAFPAWRRTPPEDRIQYLFKLKTLLEEHQDDLARTCTMENGKTLTESKAEIRRAPVAFDSLS